MECTDKDTATGHPAPWCAQKALERLSSACARAEQCEADLRRKMREHGVPPADASQVMDYLRKHRFVDDTRYACAFARDKVRFNGWGRIKVAMMLRTKHIDEETIKAALCAVEPEVYSEVLSKLVKAESRRLVLDRYADRLKLTRKLYARGFEPELIKEAIYTLTNSGE